MSSFSYILMQRPHRRHAAHSDAIGYRQVCSLDYVFCRFQLGTHRVGVTTSGARSIAGTAGKPMPIPDEEIAALQAIIASGLAVEPWDYLPDGEIVQVEQGPLRGLRGVLAGREDSWRLVVSVKLLVRSAAVVISRDMFSPMSTSSAVA